MLAQALHIWLGPALQPALSELKPVQVKELNETFAKMDVDGQGQGTRKQERFTKAQERERATVTTVDDEELETNGLCTYASLPALTHGLQHRGRTCH